MRFPNSDSDTVALMGRVCGEAWHEVQATTFFASDADACEVISLLATSVMVAIADGERCPEALKAIALARVSRKH